MEEKRIKEVLLSMTKEIFDTFRLLSEENKKLQKRVEELEKKFNELK